MFGQVFHPRAFHPRPRAMARTFRIDADRKGAAKFVVNAAEAAILVGAGALFAFWLMSSAPFSERGPSGLASGCENLGRGGNPCVLRPTLADRPDQSVRALLDCENFGKGGRLCLPSRR
jgi:hypothetical protein